MLTKVDALTGQGLMRLWGVESWEDPGAEYVVWDDCCVFALVAQDGFVDIHLAMRSGDRVRCRDAGREILEAVGHHKLRAPILPGRKSVINYARRMGFDRPSTNTVELCDGTVAELTFMWREPHGRSVKRCSGRAEHNNRCNRGSQGGKGNSKISR